MHAKQNCFLYGMLLTLFFANLLSHLLSDALISKLIWKIAMQGHLQKF